MKKVLITIVCLFMLSSIGMASPLLDYSKGDVSFDYTYRPNLDMSGTTNFGYRLDTLSGTYPLHESFDGSANLDVGLTIGMGNNWAVQYRQYNPQGSFGLYSGSVDIGNGTLSGSINATGKIRQDEFKVLYKLSPNTAAFVGVVRANAGIKLGGSATYTDTPYAVAAVSSGTWSGGINLPEFTSPDKNMVQFGLLGSTTIAKNLEAYGVVSFASDYRNWEAGLSYDIDPNWQFNVSYRDTKWDKMKLGNAYISSSTGNIGSLDVGLDDIHAKGWGFGLTYKF